MDPLNETILLCIHQGMSVREIMRLLGQKSPHAVHVRMEVLEGGGYVLPPSVKGGTDRRLSEFGVEYMKAQGYIR